MALTLEEQKRQEDLQRLRGLRPIDDDFMRCLFKDNIPLVELVLRIITGKPDLIITNCQTQKDMKRLGGARSICLDASLNKVDWLTLTEKILFRDENRISVRQFRKVLPGIKVFYVHHTGMVSGPVWVCPLIFPLNFHVIFFPGSIRSIGIQTDRPRPAQPFHILLRLAVGDNQRWRTKSSVCSARKSAR